jgi:hypothetical protein
VLRLPQVCRSVVTLRRGEGFRRYGDRIATLKPPKVFCGRIASWNFRRSPSRRPPSAPAGSARCSGPTPVQAIRSDMQWPRSCSVMPRRLSRPTPNPITRACRSQEANNRSARIIPEPARVTPKSRDRAELNQPSRSNPARWCPSEADDLFQF